MRVLAVQDETGFRKLSHFILLDHPARRALPEVANPTEGEVLVELSGLMEATKLQELPLSGLLGDGEPSDIAPARHVFGVCQPSTSLSSRFEGEFNDDVED